MGILGDIFKGATGSDSIAGGIGSAFGGPVLGAAAGALTNSIFGPSKGSIKRNQRDLVQGAYDTQRNLAEYGAQLDLGNQKKMLDFRVMRGIEAGLTPYEVWGAGAGSAGGGAGPTGGTLGNGGVTAQMQAAQMAQQNKMTARENAANRATQLAQTKMQADAQKEVAEISAGVTARGQDIQAMIAGNKLQLDRRQLEEVAIPDLENKTGLNEQQIKIAINEAANTDPKWVRKKTVMQLGVDNGIQNLILGKLNLDLTNPKQIQALSNKQYEDALTALLSASSAIGKNTSAVENILNRIFSTVKKDAEQRAYEKAYERGSRMRGSPNPQAGFTGYVLGNKGPVPAGTPKYKNFNRDFPNY